MLQWCRIRAASIASVAILSMAIVGGSAAVPHEDDCHDAACVAVAVEHDAAAHRVSGTPDADEAHTLHCLVCHWARSFRPPAEARVASVAAAVENVSLPHQVFTPSVGAPVSQPPLRSPPASPLLG